MERAAVATCLLVIVFTFVAAGLAFREGEQALDVRAQEVAGDVAQGIREIVDRDTAVATVLATQIEDPTSISSRDWSARVARAWRAGAFQEVHGVNLALRATSTEQLESYLAARPEGQQAPFELRTADEPPHIVIFQVWPVMENTAALGFDIATLPEAYEVADRALKANVPLASPPLRLVQEREGQQASVVYVPVITPADGRVRGAVTLAFRADQVLSRVVPRGANDAEIGWQDTAAGADRLMAGADLAPDEARATVEIAGFGPAWVISADVTRASLGILSRAAPWIILVAGMALAVAMLLVFSSGTRLRRRAEVLADERGEALRAQTTELQLANEELRDLDAVKDRVLRSVIHDLRGPLTVIAGMTELLTRGGLDADRSRQLLERVRYQAARADGMVEELVTASQLETGRLQPTPGHVELEELVARIVRDLPESPAPLQLTTVPGADPAVHADAAHVERIVGNLLANAVRHGHPPVEVTLDGAHRFVELRVRDHGPGVPEDARQRIFKEFTSLASDAQAEGLGLGLAISRRLAELNGGSLRCIAPEDGPGAIFVLRLPASQLHGRPPVADPVGTRP